MNDETMIPCDHVIALLWEYVDGSLDQLRSEQVRRHIDMCARCFPEYDFRRAYVRFMGRCSTQEVKPELRRRIFEMILEEERKVALEEGASAGVGMLDRTRQVLRGLFGRRRALPSAGRERFPSKRSSRRRRPGGEPQKSQPRFPRVAGRRAVPSRPYVGAPPSTGRRGARLGESPFRP